MRRKLVLLPCVMLAGCALMGPSIPKLPDDTQFLNIDGVRFAAPQDRPWYIERWDRYSLAIVKPGANENETLAVSAQLFHAPAPEPGKDFVQQVKEAEEKDSPPPRYKLTLHEVTAATVGKAQCARSHSIAEDHSPTIKGGKTGPTMLLEILSLNCPHPDDPRVAFNIEYSDRYYPGNADPEFVEKGEVILNSAELTQLVEK